MVWLHRDIQGVWTIAKEPGEEGGGREEGISGTYTTATHALRHTPILLFCGCQTVIHIMNCITQIAMVKSPAERENTWMNAQKHCILNRVTQ